jgi:hypothetical protein
MDPMDFPPPPPREARTSSSSAGCLKWGLIGCGAVLGLFILVSVGIGWYVTRHGKEIVAATERAERAGIATARGTDEKGCVDAAERRMEKEGGMLSGGVRGSIFLDACLRSSRPTPGFCDGVPRSDEVMETSQWQQMRCNRSALNPAASVRCNATASAVQRYCRVEGREKADPDSALARLDSTLARLDSMGMARRPR